MKKRLILLFILVIVVFTLTGCFGDSKDEENDNNNKEAALNLDSDNIKKQIILLPDTLPGNYQRFSARNSQFYHRELLRLAHQRFF